MRLKEPALVQAAGSHFLHPEGIMLAWEASMEMLESRRRRDDDDFDDEEAFTFDDEDEDDEDFDDEDEDFDDEDFDDEDFEEEEFEELGEEEDEPKPRRRG
jgi:hypothetical protein